MVQGGSTIIKYLLFFFNFVFVVTGLALIIVGALVESRARNYLNFLDSPSVSTAVFIIVLGVIVFIIAFLGCCGAIKENHCMVLTFSILLFVLFIMELSAGIAAYVFRNKLDDVIHDGFTNAFEKWNETRTDQKAARGWDDLQKGFDCCGVNGPEDYFNGTIANNTYMPLQTCCDPDPDHMNCTYIRAHHEGCAEEVIHYFKDNLTMVGGAGIGVAFVEIMGIVFACCLARAIKKEYEVV